MWPSTVPAGSNLDHAINSICPIAIIFKNFITIAITSINVVIGIRFYIASADKSGKVRIWDTVNKEHILKNEFQPISGPIKDLAWSSDNQR